MRILFLLPLLLLCSLLAQAQDLVVLVSGPQIRAKVTDVTATHLVYTPEDKPGETVSTPIKDVAYVLYANGKRDDFADLKGGKAGTAPQTNPDPVPYQAPPPPPAYTEPTYTEPVYTAPTPTPSGGGGSGSHWEAGNTYGVMLGIRTIKVQKTNLYFAYVDESPSEDNMVSTVTVNAQTFSPSISLFFEKRFDKNFFLHANIDGSIGSGWAIEGGLGGAFGNAIMVRPAFYLGYYMYGVRLGYLSNNDVYIQVNDAQFYSSTVTVRLESSFIAARPALEFWVPFGYSGMGLLADVSYVLAASSGGSYLNFSGQDANGTTLSEAENIDQNNVYLSIDGTRVAKTFINPSGLVARIGLTF